MDKSLHLLIGAINATRGTALWVADEHVTAAALAQVQPRADLCVITNRCDVAAHCEQRGIRVATNDFLLSSDQHYAAIFFRVAKEKALVHHVINTALDALAIGGTLWLAGDKNDGIKTYLDKAATRAGTAASLQRDGASLLGAVQRGAQLGALLPDQTYAELRHVEFSAEFSAWSKPGIFGWQKIDAGSAFLIEHLRDVFPQYQQEPPARVLDLGCGYGYLSVSAARQWPATEFVASDNNATAVAACVRNFSEYAIHGEVICSDCGAAIDEKFSAILCNPPFHQGFDVDAELTARFLRNTRRLLARGGRALFVVNQFIGLERAATPLFARVDVVARNKSFKLVVLEA
jgi:16S rRNA (guanine1207-N2)-methyltransferase